METYKFPATVNKVVLGSKKEIIVIGEGPRGKPIIEKVDTPHVTITLSYTDERAASIAARMAAFQGYEVVLELDGEARQLNLL